MSIILASAFILSSIPSVPVYAAEKDNLSAGQKTIGLTGLQISGLDVPADGKSLDDRALITTSQGVKWEIPVIWMDETGKTATVKEAGKKYLPNFIFYLPSGYSIKGAFKVKIPAFLRKMYGADNLLFISDPATGITYISWNAGKISGFTIPRVPNNTRTSVVSTSSSSAEEETVHISYEYESVPDPGISSEERERLYKDVDIHCTAKSIELLGYDNLAWLVDHIKNDLEPKSVAALLDGFPAFKAAAENGELSKNIGLCIYDSRVDTQNDDNNFLPQAAGIYIGRYSNDLTLYASRILINSAELFELNESGDYKKYESNVRIYDYAIIHELMHAFMADYTKTGSTSYDNSFFYPTQPGDEPNPYNEFPSWFVEGTAGTVQNGYEYNKYYLNPMTVIGNGGTLTEGEPVFTTDSVSACLSDPANSLQSSYYDYFCDATGPYVGGYLATVYLSSLVASGGSINEVPDNELVKSGLNTILEKLHNGTPLDTIIRDTGKYDGVRDFEEKFATANDESTIFVTDFLNYLDSISSKEHTATGCILMSFDSKSDLLDERTETRTEQEVFRIYDSPKFIISSVDVDKAHQSAGTFHVWDDTDWDPALKYESKVAAIPAYNSGPGDCEDAEVIETVESVENSEMLEAPEVGEADEAGENIEADEADENIEADEADENVEVNETCEEKSDAEENADMISSCEDKAAESFETDATGSGKSNISTDMFDADAVNPCGDTDTSDMTEAIATNESSEEQ